MLTLVVALLPAAGASAEKRNWHLGDRTLREGHTGHDVRVLQKFLTRAGVKAEVDGDFGRDTKIAWRRFERFQRRRVDGLVTPKDVVVLRDVARNGGAVATAASGGAMPKNVPLPAPPATPDPAPLQVGPGTEATIGSDGLAVAPALAPPIVQQLIAAGNEIAAKPYIYGGGHRRWDDDGYDCSGSVSYALHRAGLLEDAVPSGEFMGWGDSGPGEWVTVLAHGGHVYMIVAGLRFDTSGRTRSGTRWQTEMRDESGYVVRHPPGL